MSFERDSARAAGPQAPGQHLARTASLRPAASIARSISWGFTWRKLVNYLLEDVLLACVLALVFIWHCTTTLPTAAADGITYNMFWSRVVRPDACAFVGTSPQTWKLIIRGANGVTYPFALIGYLQLLVAPCGFWLLTQFFDLFDFFSDTRRVRRKLQPLNDLAVAAESLGQVAATTDPMAADKMATLEQAIERATVDSPTVSTGDRDLRSIEVALNGLLRQMQEAKLQQMRFVSDASHELRTPIAVIQGYVNMLDRWGKTDEDVLD